MHHSSEERAIDKKPDPALVDLDKMMNSRLEDIAMALDRIERARTRISGSRPEAVLAQPTEPIAPNIISSLRGHVTKMERLRDWANRLAGEFDEIA